MTKRKSTKADASTDTIVTFLLDKSGSMASILDDTIGAFNAYLDGLRKTKNLTLSLVQFDSQSLDKTFVRMDPKVAPNLTKANYIPGAATPLIDAAFKTIKAVEGSLVNEVNRANKAYSKVVICIQTDGHENASTEHTWNDLNALIKEKMALGWQFIFMGAGIDAYDQGARMGISTANTVSYDHTNTHATRASFTASACNTAMFSAGTASHVGYSADQKLASGDKFVGGVNIQINPTTPAHPPATPKVSVNFTLPQQPLVTPAKPRPVVDDFTL